MPIKDNNNMWTEAQERHAKNLIAKTFQKYNQYNCTDTTGQIPLNWNMSREITDPADPDKTITVQRVLNVTENLVRGTQAYNEAVGNRISPTGLMVNIVATLPPTITADVYSYPIVVEVAQTANRNLPTPAEYWDSSLGGAFAPLGFRNATRLSDYNQLARLYFDVSRATNQGRLFTTYIKKKSFIELTTNNNTDMGKSDNLESGGIFILALSDIQYDKATASTQAPQMFWYTRLIYANNSLSVNAN